MTVVFVHGNPETSAIWGPLVAALGRDDVVLLSPPGFGAPLPEGFGATYLEYRDWLETELEKIDGPIDLVGHDWGGGHVVNVVMHRPELVRSWASDVVGLFDPDYVWHDMAQVWQTPGAGEEMLQNMMGGGVEARTELMVSLGIPADIGAAIAEHQNDDMMAAILALYRSAAQPAMARIRPPRTAVPKPSMVSRSVIAAVRPRSAALTTSRNSPRVSSTKGSDRSRRTGPTIALTTPKISPIHR